MRLDAEHCASECDVRVRLKKHDSSRHGQSLSKGMNKETTPWDAVNVNSIGPWTFTNNAGKERVMNAISIMDLATGSLKSCRARNPSSLEASQLFDTNWLCKFPKPRKIICDQGFEFKLEFIELCESYGIKRFTSSRRSPHSDTIIERVLIEMLNALRTLEFPSAM